MDMELALSRRPAVHERQKFGPMDFAATECAICGGHIACVDEGFACTGCGATPEGSQAPKPARETRVVIDRRRLDILEQIERNMGMMKVNLGNENTTLRAENLKLQEEIGKLQERILELETAPPAKKGK